MLKKQQRVGAEGMLAECSLGTDSFLLFSLKTSYLTQVITHLITVCVCVCMHMTIYPCLVVWTICFCSCVTFCIWTSIHCDHITFNLTNVGEKCLIAVFLYFVCHMFMSCLQDYLQAHQLFSSYMSLEFVHLACQAKCCEALGCDTFEKSQCVS